MYDARMSTHLSEQRNKTTRISGVSSDRVKKTKNVFRTTLLKWYKKNSRANLPWRMTRDPYAVLVSELMLQQTQVPRVIPKYDAFLTCFPTIEALAQSDRTVVLAHWQGLGYNNRAVRLHALAKIIMSEHNGKLPDEYDELRKLPGIGPYTAGAIMSFAYNKPAPCVDVNIRRVIVRIFWEKSERAHDENIKILALDLVHSAPPHEWHSALMDFGSAVCTARKPHCKDCPMRAFCVSKGLRPDETIASKPQSTFKGSVRWWRGRILKTLLAGAVNERHLLHRIKENPDSDDEDRCETALASMIKEGLVIKKIGVLQLADA